MILEGVDQISWGSVCIPKWSAYLSEKSLDSMKTFGVPLQNTMFTVLCYGRAIIGSQSDRHEGLVDKTCPLFQCCVALIEDEIYETDYNTLDSLVPREKMMINSALDGSLNNYQYKGRYALLPECNNRFAFIGAFAWVWFVFQEKFRTKVKTRHGYEYVSFVMRECNGSPLMIRVMVSLTDDGNREDVEKMLAEPASALCIHLSKAMRKWCGPEGRNISSQTPRWQNVDHPVWRDEKDTSSALIHVQFVTGQLCMLRTKQSGPDCLTPQRLLCSGTARRKAEKWNDFKLGVLKLGAVRGNFGIQLSASLLLTLPEYGNHATIEKGKSGYYKCVNFHLRNKYNGKNLSSEQATYEVGECLKSLQQSGFPVTKAWMDQNCCYWSRQYGRDDGLDGRKKDVFFFDTFGQLFPPIRLKDFASGVMKVQLFVVDAWYNLDVYWQPAYELVGLDVTVWRRIDGKRTETLSSWVKSIGRDGFIIAFRREKCKLTSGGYSLF
jgi:hypothetical protein